MERRIIDRLFLLISSAVAVSAAADCGVISVAFLLAGLLCIVLSELFRRTAPTVIAVLALSCALFSGCGIMLIPLAVYCIFTGVDFVKTADIEYERFAMYSPADRSDFRRLLPYASAALAMSAALVFAAEKYMSMQALAVPSGILLFAAYLGITRSFEEGRILRLRSAADNLKSDVIRAGHSQKQSIEHESEAVYTATLKERNRIAGEIHDNVGHMITRSLVQMQALKIINRDPAVAGGLDSVSESLDEAMTSIRRSVHALHDESIDLAIEVSRAASILDDRFDVEVNTSIDKAVPTEIAEAITAVVKEACTNISRYSSGRRVQIQVVQNNTFYRVRISDDGSSGHDYRDGSKGMGLSDIRDRVLKLGGRCEITGSRDGFTVFATIPVSMEQ